MYRKPLLTVEDGKALIGKLVRLEFSRAHLDARWVGIVTRLGSDWGGNTESIYFTAPDGGEDGLRFIEGTYVVFATTADDMRVDEAPFVHVTWRDRRTLAVNTR